MSDSGINVARAWTRWRVAGGVLAALPAILWLTVLARETVNLPCSDDHFSLLPFASDWHEAGSLADRWQLLTGQFISHRIVVAKTAAALSLAVFGGLNFVALQMAGWLGWLVVVGGICAATPIVRQHPWLALPVALLLLHIEGYSNFLIAVGMGNLWVVAFALVSAMWVFDGRRSTFVAAVVSATLSALSFVNGLLVFPAVTLALVLRREYRRAGWFAAPGALVWLLYLGGYHHEMGPLSLPEMLRKTAIMTGGLFKLARTPDAVCLFGGAVILLAVCSVLATRRLWRDLPVHGTFLLFLVGSVLTAARGRSGWDDWYMLQDRYRLYGLLMIAVLFLVAVQWMGGRQRAAGIAATALAAVYCLLSYASLYAPMRAARNWCVTAALNWQLEQCFPCAHPDAWAIACAELERAGRLGVFRLPRYLSPAELAFVRTLPAGVPADSTCTVEPNGAAVGVSICPRQSDTGSRVPAPDFGVLVLGDRQVVLPVEKFRTPLGDLLSQCSPLSSRFGLVLPRSPFYVPGVHAIHGVHRSSGGVLALAWSRTVALP